MKLDINLPPLEIEYDAAEGRDAQVTLRQDQGGNISEVYLHPIQVQLLGERLGLAMPDLQPGPRAQMLIDSLTRKLAALHYRIDEMDNLIMNADHEHANLSELTAHSRASLEIAIEYMLEIDPNATKFPASTDQ